MKTIVYLFTGLILIASPLLSRGHSQVQEKVGDVDVDVTSLDNKTTGTGTGTDQLLSTTNRVELNNTEDHSHHHHHHHDSHNPSHDNVSSNGNSEESKISDDPSTSSTTTLLSLSIVANVLLILALIAAVIYFRLKIQKLETGREIQDDLTDDFSTSPVGEKEEFNVGVDPKVKGNREQVGYEIAKV